MKQETLTQLSKYTHKGMFSNFFSSAAQEEMRRDVVGAIKFIRKLKKKGVPLSDIHVTDWARSSVIVIIGNKKYAKFKSSDIKDAYKYYNSYFNSGHVNNTTQNNNSNINNEEDNNEN